MVLMAGLLVLVESQASDVADRSTLNGFLSKYMPSGSGRVVVTGVHLAALDVLLGVAVGDRVVLRVGLLAAQREVLVAAGAGLRRDGAAREESENENGPHLRWMQRAEELERVVLREDK